MAFCSVYGEFYSTEKEAKGLWMTAFSRAPEGKESELFLAQELTETMPKGEWLLTVKPLKPGVVGMVSEYQSSNSSILAIKDKVFAATSAADHVAMIHLNKMDTVPESELVDFYDAVDDFVDEAKLHTLRIGLDRLSEDGTAVSGWYSKLNEQTNEWSPPLTFCGSSSIAEPKIL